MLTPVEVDYKAGTATFSGRHGTYQATLNSCSCFDFGSRRLPCKHIYRLAHEMNFIRLEGPVESNSDAIQIPDENMMDNRVAYFNKILDVQPKESYSPMLKILQEIALLDRPQLSINAAIKALESKVQQEYGEKDTISLWGKFVVLTGEFAIFTREEAMVWLASKGAKVSSSVASKTDYLVAGKTEENAFKLQRARELGVPILTEQEFADMMQKDLRDNAPDAQ